MIGLVGFHEPKDKPNHPERFGIEADGTTIRFEALVLVECVEAVESVFASAAYATGERSCGAVNALSGVLVGYESGQVYYVRPACHVNLQN